jgi:hypothetical protein
VQVDADGGLTPIAAIDGSVVDSVSPPSAGLNGCTPSCNLPCDLHYQMNGTLQK